MIVYPSRIVPDLHGLAYVLEGKTKDERLTRLAEFLGKEIIEAVRALDDYEDVGTTVPAICRAFLTPGLKAAYDCFEGRERLTSSDLVSSLGVSGSTASSRLTDLEQLGLIVMVGRDGRERMYGKV